MLLIQYPQFVVFSQGSGSWLLVFFLQFFVFICDLHRCLLKFLVFFYFFGSNIHSLGGAIKLFSRLLWVVDAAHSAINFFSSIEFSTRFIRQVAPLVFFRVLFCLPPKRPSPFFS